MVAMDTHAYSNFSPFNLQLYAFQRKWQHIFVKEHKNVVYKRLSNTLYVIYVPQYLELRKMVLINRLI